MKVVLQGLGPIGIGTAKLILNDPSMQIVGAVDIDPQKVGRDLGDLLGVGYLNVLVRDNAEQVFKEVRPDVVLLATCSDLKRLLPQLKATIENGINVVSPSEELFYPEFIDEDIAEEIDNLAKKFGVRILGGAVNPGCLMDAYPMQVLRDNFDEIESVKVYRWDNSIERRLPLLKKTGAGMNKEEFAEKAAGHVGLKMSAVFLASNLDLHDYSVFFLRKPMTAYTAIKPVHGELIETGRVTGLNEICEIRKDGKAVITLDLRMFVGAENKNNVEVTGAKNGEKFTKTFDYSNIVDGDIATMIILKDMMSKAVSGNPGLNSIGYVPDPLRLLCKTLK